MESKKTILNSQLTAGILARYGQIDNLTKDVFIKMISNKKNVDYIENETDAFKEYTNTEDGVIRLSKQKNDLISYNGSQITLQLFLEKIAGDFVLKLLDSVSFKDLVIRKVDLCGSVDYNKLYELFNSQEVGEINFLIEEGILYTSWNDDIPHYDFLEVYVSKEARVQLFVKDNIEEVDDFLKQLMALRLNTDLIEDYLKSRDLTDYYVPYILDVESFIEFCKEYDLCMYKEVLENITYQKIPFSYSGRIEEYGQKMIEKLLSVYDEKHQILICHPNYILKGVSLSNTNNTIQNIDWAEIDIKVMYGDNDYATFTELSPNRAFDYICGRIRHVLKEKENNGITDTVSHLVVLEKYPLDDNEHYIVRGIVKGSKYGYEIGFNPEFEKTVPTTYEEKYYRTHSTKRPDIYELKRKK